MVEPLLRRNNTNMMKFFSVNERLALTMRYSAKGRNFDDLKFSNIMHPVTIKEAVSGTCKTLVYIFYMKVREHRIGYFPTSYVAIFFSSFLKLVHRLFIYFSFGPRLYPH